VISIQQELLYELISDAEKLFADHHQETIGNELEFTPDWNYYAANEQAGTLRIYTARDGGELIGYAVFFVMPHRKHSKSVFAVSDAIYLRPDKRGLINFNLLSSFAENQLKAEGVFKIMVTFPVKKDTSPIWYRRGYKDDEKTMSKLL